MKGHFIYCKFCWCRTSIHILRTPSRSPLLTEAKCLPDFTLNSSSTASSLLSLALLLLPVVVVHFSCTRIICRSLPFRRRSTPSTSSEIHISSSNKWGDDKCGERDRGDGEKGSTTRTPLFLRWQNVNVNRSRNWKQITVQMCHQEWIPFGSIGCQRPKANGFQWIFCAFKLDNLVMDVERE